MHKNSDPQIYWNWKKKTQNHEMGLFLVISIDLVWRSILKILVIITISKTIEFGRERYIKIKVPLMLAQTIRPLKCLNRFDWFNIVNGTFHNPSIHLTSNDILTCLSQQSCYIAFLGSFRASLIIWLHGFSNKFRAPLRCCWCSSNEGHMLVLPSLWGLLRKVREWFSLAFSFVLWLRVSGS